MHVDADASPLHAAVEAYFTENAGTYGLDPSSLDVIRVLNWGGFVNQSFGIGDGRTRLHLKLATFDDARSALRRWHDVDATLRQYHAPPILGWVDVADAGGLLFPFVEGAPPQLSTNVLQAIVPLLGRLWNDASLATMLPRQHATAADAYFGSDSPKIARLQNTGFTTGTASHFPRRPIQEPWLTITFTTRRKR